MEESNKCFSIDLFIEKLQHHYLSWNPPLMAFILKRGVTPFEILVSTLLSLRTKDEITSGAADRLFKMAREPREMLLLGKSKIRDVIYPVGFYRKKADQIIKISRAILEEYGGFVPDDMNTLLTLPGVGRKTANLVLSEGFNIPSICVDTHVHRISNRIGYVSTYDPNATEFVLREKLPKKYWTCYNRLLVALGQIICRPVSPICTKCPVEFICYRVGVKKYR